MGGGERTFSFCRCSKSRSPEVSCGLTLTWRRWSHAVLRTATECCSAAWLFHRRIIMIAVDAVALCVVTERDRMLQCSSALSCRSAARLLATDVYDCCGCSDIMCDYAQRLCCSAVRLLAVEIADAMAVCVISAQTSNAAVQPGS